MNDDAAVIGGDFIAIASASLPLSNSQRVVVCCPSLYPLETDQFEDGFVQKGHSNYSTQPPKLT